MRRLPLLLVCLLTTGCGFAQDGLAANGDGLAPETPGVRRTAEVDARAYAGFAAAVVLHERSDFIRDELQVHSVVEGLTPDELARRRTEAKELWDEAVVLYRTALSRDANSADVCSQLARGYFDRDDRTQGFSWLERAVKLDDGNFMFLFRLGMRFEEDRKTTEAIDAYARAEAARDDPDKHRMLPLVMLKYGGLAKAAGRLKDAVDVYRRFTALPKEPDHVYEPNTALIELMSNRAPVWRELAEVHTLLGNHLEAARAWGEAYRLQPEVTRSLAQMGLAYSEGAQYPLAVETLAKYIQVLSDELEKTDLDEVEEDSDDEGDARVERLKYLRLQREFLQALQLIVEVYKKRDKTVDNLAAAQRCAAENPRLYQVHFLIGSYHEQKNDLAKAAEAYGEIARQRKPLLMAYLKLADVELKQKRYERVLTSVAAGISSGLRSRMLGTLLNQHLDGAAAVPAIVARCQAAVPAAGRDFGYHYVLGVLHEKLRETDAAVRAFEETVRQKPDFAPAWVALASLQYLNLRKPVEAIDTLKKATGQLPNDEILWRFMADVQVETGDYAGAADAMRHVVELSPESSANQLLYAGMLHRAGRTADAESYILGQMSTHPDDAEQWYVIWGNFHLGYTRRIDRAVEVLRQGTAAHPGSFDLAAALGDALLRKHDYAGAADALHTALRIEPASITAHIYLALALEKHGKPDEAEKVLRDARAVYPTSTPVAVELGGFLVRTKRAPDEGLALIRKAVTADSGRTLTHLALVRACMQLKRYDDALAACTDALKVEPDSSDVRRQLAFVYDEMGQFDKAEIELQKCLEKDPADDMAANALAYLYAERSVKLDEARRLVEIALKADPENGAYLDSMGWVLYRRGDFKGALEYLQKAAEQESDAVIVDHLGDVCVKLGLAERALREYEKAAGLDTDRDTRAAEKLELLKAGKDPLVEKK